MWREAKWRKPDSPAASQQDPLVAATRRCRRELLSWTRGTPGAHLWVGNPGNAVPTGRACRDLPQELSAVGWHHRNGTGGWAPQRVQVRLGVRGLHLQLHFSSSNDTHSPEPASKFPWHLSPGSTFYLC